MPGQVSVRTPPVCRVGWGEGPVGRMRSRQRADTRKLAALNRSAETAPTAWAASPANPRPAIAATEAPPWSRALPATSSAAVTREGRQTWYAVANKTLAVPASSATTTSWPVLSTPSQAPAGRPITSHGRYAAAVRAATAKVLARRTVTAASGTPTTAIELPAPLIVSPIPSSWKVRRGGQGRDGEGARAQDGDRGQRDPDHRHRAAGPADRLPDPQQPEVPLPEQAAGASRAGGTHGACGGDGRD